MSAPTPRNLAIGLMLAAAVVSFIAFVVLRVFGGDMIAPPSHGADGYSVSALGHRAFRRLLEESGTTVTSSRFDSAKRAAVSSLLVVAEPDLSDDLDRSAERLFRGMLARPGVTLVVLPRRDGFDDFEHEGYVRWAYEHPEGDVQKVLAVIDRGLTLVRRPVGTDPFDARDVGPRPSLPGPVQLIKPSSHLEPLISLGGEVLLGRVLPTNDRSLSEVYILSDPDLIATHGLVRGDNATLAVAIVERLRPQGGSVLFDETLHGFDIRPSLWRELFRPPLVFATGSALFAGLVLVAAGLGRFGRERPAPPPIEPGKRFLVDHTAELLRQGGHAGHALERYLAATIQDTGRALHAPASLDAKALRAWFGEGGRGGRGSRTLTDLEAQVAVAVERDDPHDVIAAATAVHEWKETTTHGSRDDS